MTATKSIFGISDPFDAIRAGLDEAAETEPNDPNAIALATVDADGLPNVRIVLLKSVETDAFVFYTNYNSRKGQEIDGSGRAAFVLHWKTLRRQIRVRGSLERTDDRTADAYFQSRDLQSRLGAWASRQSQPLRDRLTLEKLIADAKQEFGDSPPRPNFWGGFRLRPSEIEFWQDGAHRLHDRERWVKPDQSSGWAPTRLFP